ncbi:MAG: S1/P1 nuclease [Bryobacterales bacterium]
MRMLCLFLLCAASAPAWGPTGHRVVAILAEERLDPALVARIRVILGGDSLADVSTWADEARNLPNWRHSGPWHYVNIGDGETYKSSRKEKRGDVLRAIERFQKDLTKRSGSLQKQRDALRFLIHFVADLHQPLHVGRAEDRGGNLIEVDWFGRRSNLHRVWDSDIIAQQRISFTRWAASLPRPTPEQAALWAKSKPLDWAVESQRLRPAVYRIRDGKLGQPYYADSLPIVRERLTQASVRLAALLEQSLR